MRKLPATRDELRESLGATRLPAGLVAHLAGQARAAIALTATACDEAKIPVGASKMGGCPDLPAGMAWPVRPAYPDGGRRAAEHRQKAETYLAAPPSWTTVEKAKGFAATALRRAEAAESWFPLSFFIQVDLADIASMPGFALGLPAAGRLLFFYDHFAAPAKFDPASRVGWRLIWDATPVDGLVRAPAPRELVEISGDSWSAVFGAARVAAESVVTPMPCSDKGWDAFSFDDDAAYDAYDAWIGRFGMPDDEGGNRHLLGGFPLPLQNGMQATAQLASHGIFCGTADAQRTPQAVELLKTARDWRLVLQLGPEPGLRMGSVGALYVLMRERDIADRAFERAWVVYDG